MATRVLPFTATIPPGTPIAAPFTQAMALDTWNVERLDLEVPAGPAGLMGFQIYNNGVAYIPYGAGNWIVWDDVKDSYYLEDLPNASGWAIVGYNLGFYAHQVKVYAHVSSALVAAPAIVVPNITMVTSDQPLGTGVA
jgi:hypothetical protein